MVYFTIKETPLQVYIKGGNKMQAYSSPLKINAVAKDLDVELSQQQEGIILSNIIIVIK